MQYISIYATLAKSKVSVIKTTANILLKIIQAIVTSTIFKTDIIRFRIAITFAFLVVTNSTCSMLDTFVSNGENATPGIKYATEEFLK